MNEKQKLDDGGPAFARPTTWSPGLQPDRFNGAVGMSLRDYFAAAAVQSVVCGILADQNGKQDPDWLASTAYDIADAMILQRSKRTAV